MALESFLDSNYRLAMGSLAPSQVTGGFVQFSNSNNLPQKGEHHQAVIASLLNATTGNLSNTSLLNASMVSGDTTTILNDTMNLGLSVDASSLVPDANSAVSKGPQLHSSSGTNMDSYLNLPPSPAFSSHNLSTSGSSIKDGSSKGQQISCLGQNSLQVLKGKQQQGGLTASMLHALQKNSFLHGIKQELCTSTQMHKKPRLDIKQDATLYQYIIQELMQSQDSDQLQGHVPELQASFQQHNLQNQNQLKVVQSLPPLWGVDMNQQLLQMKYHLQQQSVGHVPAYPLDGGVCSRRLMQYLYHLRHRPPDNSITYWRKLVAEYYAPRAKQRWCSSLCNNVKHHAHGVFPVAAMDTWQCDICGSKSGRGFEVISEVLPRLNKITFESGMIDELLFLDMPLERRCLSGLTVLEYGKAVHQSIYEQLRVVREGKLRIIFTHDLKILSWEFCAHHHEELLPRNLVAPQVNQLAHAALKYQSTIGGSRCDKISTQNLQAHCDAFLVAGRQLVRNLDLRLVDELGFSNRYIRCLRIAETVNSMKDLMTFSLDNNIGPIESLKNYPPKTTTTKLWKDEVHGKEWLENAQGLPTDTKKLIGTSPGLSTSGNESSSITNSRFFTGLEESAFSPYGKHNSLREKLNSNISKVRQEPSCSYNRSKQGASSTPVEGSNTVTPGMIQNLSVSGSSRSHSIEGSQNIQECVIQKLLQEMVHNSRAVSRGEAEKVNQKISSSAVPGLPNRASGTNIAGSKMVFENSNAAAAAPVNARSSVEGKISSFVAASIRDSYGVCGNDSFIKREPDLPEKLDLPEVVQNMVCGYYDNGISDGNGANVSYGWKA